MTRSPYLLAFAVVAACDTARGVNVEMYNPVLVVDSSDYHYSGTATAVVRLAGAGKDDVHLLVYHVTSAKATKAGEATMNENLAQTIVGDSGTIQASFYLNRCSTYTKGSCVEAYFDPDMRMRPVALIRGTNIEPRFLGKQPGLTE